MIPINIMASKNCVSEGFHKAVWQVSGMLKTTLAVINHVTVIPTNLSVAFKYISV